MGAIDNALNEPPPSVIDDAATRPFDNGAPTPKTDVGETTQQTRQIEDAARTEGERGSGGGSRDDLPPAPEFDPNVNLVRDSATQTPKIAIEPLDTEVIIKRLSQGNDKIHIAEVSANEANEISTAFKNQFDESVEFKPSQVTRTINGDQIRHTLNGHGDPKREAQFGGIPVTLEDIAKYPEIVRDHNFKIYSHTSRDNRPAIVYGKQVNGYAIIVEEVRTGRGDIAFFDMYKRKGTLTEDSLRLARDRAKNEKGKLPALSHGVRERFATPAQIETIPPTAPKSQTTATAQAAPKSQKVDARFCGNDGAS
jgi:hypothetical protein